MLLVLLSISFAFLRCVMANSRPDLHCLFLSKDFSYAAWKAGNRGVRVVQHRPVSCIKPITDHDPDTLSAPSPCNQRQNIKTILPEGSRNRHKWMELLTTRTAKDRLNAKRRPLIVTQSRPHVSSNQNQASGLQNTASHKHRTSRDEYRPNYSSRPFETSSMQFDML